MNLCCNIFQTSVAHRVGVGAALHQKPPGITERADAPQLGANDAPQLGAMICSRAHMDQIHPYDVKAVSWRHAREALRALSDVAGEVDWSDGDAFPWWLCLANTGKIRDVVADGIFRVTAYVEQNGRRSMIFPQRQF